MTQSFFLEVNISMQFLRSNLLNPAFMYHRLTYLLPISVPFSQNETSCTLHRTKCKNLSRRKHFSQRKSPRSFPKSVNNRLAQTCFAAARIRYIPVSRSPAVCLDLSVVDSCVRVQDTSMDTEIGHGHKNRHQKRKWTKKWDFFSHVESLEMRAWVRFYLQRSPCQRAPPTSDLTLTTKTANERDRSHLVRPLRWPWNLLNLHGI